MAETDTPLQQCLATYLGRVSPAAARQIGSTLEGFAEQPSRAAFFHVVAMCPRWFGSESSAKPPARGDEWERLSALHPNLACGQWSDDQLARLLALTVAQAVWSADVFTDELDTLFNSADVREQVALYRSLALLEEPARFIGRAREGARSNMVPVFLAVAHDNSYPADHFDEAGWNQLVLKAVFNSCALDPIFGLDRRSNPALAHMLCDYVRERWAAKRDVPWDIWRCIGSKTSDERDLTLLAAALEADDKLTRAAAMLALRENPTSTARQLLAAASTAFETAPASDWKGLSKLGQGD